MKTTIQLEDKLLLEVQDFAVETGKSLSAVIEDALRSTLARRRRQGRKKRVKLKSHGIGGLQPGINLDNTAALLDLMESSDAAS
jgi:hypothetical protein